MKHAESAVYVVDDDPAICDAVAESLRSVGLSLRTFSSAGAFLQLQRPDIPTCLVLDVQMPELNGFDLLRQLRAAGRPVSTIFITGHGDIRMAVEAIKAGAIEFLPKPFRPQELIRAVSQALRLDAAARAQLAALAPVQDRYERLTEREREVFIEVSRGRRNKQIASDLGIKEVTVKLHRLRVMKKMGATSLAELVLMAQRLQALGRQKRAGRGMAAATITGTAADSACSVPDTGASPFPSSDR